MPNGKFELYETTVTILYSIKTAPPGYLCGARFSVDWLLVAPGVEPPYADYFRKYSKIVGKLQRIDYFNLLYKYI